MLGNKNGRGNKGKKRSKEVKKRISNTLKGKGIKPPSRKGVINKNALCHKKGIRSYYENRRRIRKNNNGGSHTFGEWETLKAQYNWTCPCCGKSEPEIKLTEDHIIPISRGGSNNIENIQPLCRRCNSKKNTRIIKYTVWGNQI